MHTRIVPANQNAISDALIILESHIPVAVPTETVYGLAAKYDDEIAIKRIFEMKGRPQDNPIIVHVSSMDQFEELGKNIPEFAKQLTTLWPGPLTLVVRSTKEVPWTTGGLETIAIRMPAHTWLQSLIDAAGPLAAPSANLSGKPSPTSAKHCMDDLRGTLPLIVDGGIAAHGVESTVVDCTGSKPRILRPGAISAEQIAERVGIVEEGGREERSPGTRYPHYAPNARVEIQKDAHHRANMYRESGKRVLLLTKVGVHVDDREFEDAEHYARMLYAWLREADSIGAEYVVAEPVPELGMGAAVMNRLQKSAKRS